MSAYIGFGEVTITGEEGDVTYEYPSLVDAKLTAKKTPINVEKEAVDTDNVVATGDILTYKVKTNVPFIAPTDIDKTFWAYDELTGAEYTKEATITLGGEDITAAYPITWETTKFSVDLSGMINDANSNAGKEVVITYKVKVTSENDVITNKATAGHKGTSDFGSTEIKVYQGNITLTKTGENDVKLPNAGFEVRKDSKESTALRFTKLADGVYKYDPKGDVTEVFTKADGTVKVQGLDVGTYYFKEKTAPEGYSVNQDQAEATLAVEGDKAAAVLTTNTSMRDTKLSALPSTGGIGTTIFTIAGCLIMIAAAGLFLLPSILPDSFAVAEASDEEDATYMDALNIAGDEMMGIVEIPKIDIKLPIYHTTNEDVLKQAAGHLEGSSLPIGGKSTHAVISAHRGLPSASLFTDLDQLDEGDHFLIHVLNETLCYEVDKISVVKPEETSALAVEEGEDLVTLLTCTPYGVNTERLLVRGHRVDYVEQEVADEKTPLSGISLHTNYLLWVIIGLSVTAIFILVLYLKEKKLQNKKDKTS